MNHVSRLGCATPPRDLETSVEPVTPRYGHFDVFSLRLKDRDLEAMEQISCHLTADPESHKPQRGIEDP